MANLLDKYGIKEVADVVFYKINPDGSRGAPVLYLDTLKVSTIEQTAENVAARGGKGNPELIIWDFNKEITLTLQDALFSARSLAMMFGSEEVNATTLVKTLAKDEVTLESTKYYFTDMNGKKVELKQPHWYKATGEEDTSSDHTDAVFVTGNVDITGYEFSINAQKFPDAYYSTGDTYARSQATGKDEYLQFIIQKAKMLSEVTLTMEAEGDPTVFDMNLKVLRPADGKMLKLVKYDFTAVSNDG